MRMKFNRSFAGALAGAAMFGLAAPAFAGVKDGVDAWSRGDFAAAVSEWRGPAAAGDADAQFNLAQAYRFGKGVAQDNAMAEQLYAQAAAQGHWQAADLYGLLLFQSGRQQEALPYVEASAARGDPRAQYLLGIAHFNGDNVPKDWVRAYALMTLANAQGMDQASGALAQMDAHIPLEQRKQAVALSQQLQRDADARRAQQLASADLAAAEKTSGRGTGTAAAAPSPMANPAITATPRVPQPIAPAAVPPSVVAAEAAVAEAARVRGTESPAEAGADYARPSQKAANPPASVARPATPPSPRPAIAPVASPAPVAATGGAWKVQLGAFSVAANANRMWDQIGGRGALAGKSKLLVPAGGVTKLQAGGFASRADADAACAALKSAGQACLVTR